MTAGLRVRIVRATFNGAIVQRPHNITPGARTYDADGNEAAAASAASTSTSTGETSSDFNQLTAMGEPRRRARARRHA